MTMVAKALVGDPLPPITPKEPHASARESIKDVIREHSKYWSCLKYGLSLPDRILLDDHPVVLPEASTLGPVAGCGPHDSPYIPFQVILLLHFIFHRISCSKLFPHTVGDRILNLL